jgi:hypothetical protein
LWSNRTEKEEGPLGHQRKLQEDFADKGLRGYKDERHSSGYPLDSMSRVMQSWCVINVRVYIHAQHVWGLHSIPKTK